MADLPNATIIRIAKKNGAERVGSDGSAALIIVTEQILGNLCKEAYQLAQHAGRKTIKEDDVRIVAAKSYNITI